MPAYLPIVSKFDPKGINQAESSVKKFGKLAAGVAAAATAAIGGIAVRSVQEFANFDAALNKSLAIMGDVSSAMENEMANAAREVAKQTSFSAEQAAESFFFLASAGLDAEASVAAMPQVAKFAQAGMFDMALATDLATDAQSALGLTVDDAQQNLANLTRVTDVFVKANTLANTSVEQLATAFTTKAGTALKTVNKDVEEGAAALAVFADQGIKGERAGTLLTNTIFGFTDIMKKAPAEAKALGLEIFDASGEMRSFADISQNLTEILGPMTKEQQIATLSQLGFTKQAREGTLALLGQSDSLREYETELRNAGGTVDEVAGKQLETLNAQFGLLKSAVSDAGIEIGGVLAPVVQGIVEDLIPLVNDLTPKLGEGLRNIVESARNVGERLGAVSSIFDRLRQSGDGGASAVDFLARQFQMLLDYLGQNMGDIFVKFMAFRQQVTTAILDALPGIIDGFLTFLPQLLSFITDTFLPMIFEQAAGIVESLLEIIVDVLPKIVKAIGDLIPQIIKAVTDLVPLLIGNLLTLVPMLLQAGLDLFTSLLDALLKVVPQIVEAVVDLIPQVLGAILEALPQILDAGLQFFMSLVEALVEIIPQLLETVVGMIPQITEQLLEFLPEFITAAIEFFLGLVTGLVDMIPELLTAIIGLIPKITDQLLEALPQIIDAGFDLFNGVVDGLLEATPEIIDALIELIPKMVDALLDNLPKLVDAGFQLLQGIAEGILTNLPRIAANLASSIGNAIRGGVESFFGISSPSKLMMGIGSDIVKGLAVGIKDTEDLAVGASLDMAASVKMGTLQGISDTPYQSMDRSFDRGFGNAGGNTYNININAGVGSDPVSIGRYVTDAIKRYETVSGKVFASA